MVNGSLFLFATGYHPTFPQSGPPTSQTPHRATHSIISPRNPASLIFTHNSSGDSSYTQFSSVPTWSPCCSNPHAVKNFKLTQIPPPPRWESIPPFVQLFALLASFLSVSVLISCQFWLFNFANMASNNDNAMARFLYAIIEQKNLKDVSNHSSSPCYP